MGLLNKKKAQGLDVKGMDDAKMRMIFLPGMMMRIKTMVMMTMARMMANLPASTIILLRRKMTMTKMMILMGRVMMATTKIKMIMIMMPSTRIPHSHQRLQHMIVITMPRRQ